MRNMGELCLIWPVLKLHQLLVDSVTHQLLVDSVIGFLNWGEALKIANFRIEI
jgi:hypothetical protein